MSFLTIRAERSDARGSNNFISGEAERLGLNVIQACSIVGVGLSPSQL